MILAVDVGNTNIVIGGIDEKRTYFLERISTPKQRTDFEYALQISSILELNGIDPDEIEGAIISSVVPQQNSYIIAAIKKVTGCTALTVNAGMKMDMNIRLDHPEEIGADLIVDSVAAMSEYPLPLAVIDLGTATTIFVVDKGRNFRGGIIHPGIRVSLEALSGNTALLPYIDLNHASSVIGTNTVDCIKNGILYGHAGMIDTFLLRMEAELGEELTAIATGGIAGYVVPLCMKDITIDDELLLKGLLILYRLNS